MAQNEDTSTIRQQIVDNRETSPLAGSANGGNAGTQTAVADNNANAGGTANASATAPATPEEVPAWAATNEQGQGPLEQRALQMAGENPTLTPEQKEAEQKKRDRNMRWAKLNDAIAAMSNLYFTSKYAPNAFDPNNLATKKLRERYDKIDADRDKERQAWYNTVMPAIKGDTENQRAYYQLQQQAQEKAADHASKERMNQVKYDTNIKIAEGQNASKERMNDANNATKVQQTKITTFGGKNYFEAYEPMADGTFKKHLYTSEEEALKHALGWGTAVEDWGEKITEDNSLMGGNKTERTLKLRPGLPEDKDHFSQRRTLPSGQ